VLRLLIDRSLPYLVLKPSWLKVMFPESNMTAEFASGKQAVSWNGQGTSSSVVDENDRVKNLLHSSIP